MAANNLNFNIMKTQTETKRFKLAYKKAVADKKEIFIFNGEEVLTNYAKYLLEYLDSQLKK